MQDGGALQDGGDTGPINSLHTMPDTIQPRIHNFMWEGGREREGGGGPELSIRTLHTQLEAATHTEQERESWRWRRRELTSRK